MKFLRTLLLPLLSILLASGNQVLIKLDNPLLGVSSNVKHTAKTDGNAGVWGKQGAVRNSVEESVKFANRVKEVQSKISKNSIKLPSGNPNIRYRYDLRGAPHKGVPTPHVQREIRNIAPDGTVHWNKDNKWVRSMQKEDLEMIEKYLSLNLKK
jgi:hypothetical protein